MPSTGALLSQVPGPPSLASAAIPAKRAASPALSATTFPSAPQTRFGRSRPLWSLFAFRREGGGACRFSQLKAQRCRLSLGALYSCDGDSEQPAPAPTAVQVRIVRDFVPVPLDLDSPAPEPSSFIPTPAWAPQSVFIFYPFHIHTSCGRE